MFSFCSVHPCNLHYVSEVISLFAGPLQLLWGDSVVQGAVTSKGRSSAEPEWGSDVGEEGSLGKGSCTQ